MQKKKSARGYLGFAWRMKTFCLGFYSQHLKFMNGVKTHEMLLVVLLVLVLVLQEDRHHNGAKYQCVVRYAMCEQYATHNITANRRRIEWAFFLKITIHKNQISLSQTNKILGCATNRDSKAYIFVHLMKKRASFSVYKAVQLWKCNCLIKKGDNRTGQM